MSRHAKVATNKATKWMREALCLGQDSAIFFPERSRRRDTLSVRESYSEARLLCSQCSVKAICLGYALANDIDTGMWGGLTPSERSLLPRETSLLPRDNT